VRGQTVLACASPQRWDFLVAALLPPWRVAAQELAQFIDGLPHERVVIVTHSAGGVAATRIAAHPKVKGIASFGYPFRHPERQCSLSHAAFARRYQADGGDPGQRDIYGGDPAQFEPLLGAACAIVSLDSDHDYQGLDDAEFARAWQAIVQVQQAACEKAVR
jgi:pimeloyl-ACP methyl ester carboxylesterase